MLNLGIYFRTKQMGNLFILSGPSGVGKTTLREHLQQRMPKLRFSVSWTSRAPRPGEKQGQDYQFVSHRQFEKNREADGFLEWARVHTDYYGTPKAPIERWLERGQDVLLDIDIQGTRQIKKRIPRAVTIFILPPSKQALKKRLLHRETESLQKIQVRLENAETELQAVKYFDYAVMNREILSSVDALEAIILATRFRVRETIK
ncbi:MAG: guanylate kinase [Desulfobacca sp.]|nr:guanylate kinase [Desulfobacca sp.]